MIHTYIYDLSQTAMKCMSYLGNIGGKTEFMRKKSLKLLLGVIKEDMRFTLFLDEETEYSNIDKYFQIIFYRCLHDCIQSTHMSFFM